MKQHLRFLILIIVLVAPAAFAAYTTPYAGGTGGSSFTIACPFGKVLVGIRGAAWDYVDRVEGICVSVNADGTWNGQPTYDGGAAGGSGGALYERLCPANSAVSVIAGRASQYVNALQIGCNPLDAGGRLKGSWTLQQTVGGPAGTAFGPTGYNCTEYRPAKGFTGSAGAWLDKIALVCDYAAPVLVAPAHESHILRTGQGNTVTLDWDDVPGATRYEICLTRLSSISCTASADTKVFTETSSRKYLVYTDVAGFYGLWLRWQVKACNDAGCGMPSVVRGVWLRYPDATLYEPADGSTTTNRPTFKWINVPGVTYKLDLTSASGAEQVHDVPAQTGTYAYFTPGADLNLASPVTWVVHICKPSGTCGDGGGNRTAGSLKSFTLGGSQPLVWSWDTRLTEAHVAEAGATLTDEQRTKLNQNTYTIGSIINSGSPVNPNGDRLFDGSKCATCHDGTSGQSANKYRPTYVTNTGVDRTAGQRVNKGDANPTATYAWNNKTAAGIVTAFLNNTNYPKPEFLEKLFSKWLAEQP